MFHFLYRNVKKESFGIFYLQLLAITQTLLALLTTWLSARLIDEIGQECETRLLITLVALSFVLIAVRMWIGRRQVLFNIKVQLSLSTDLIGRVCQHVLCLPAIELESMDLVKVNQQINQDVNSLILFALNGLVSLPSWILSGLICGVFLMRINTALLLMAFVSVILYSLLLRQTSPKIVSRSRQYIQAQTDYFSAFFQWLQHWQLQKFNDLPCFRNNIQNSFDQIEKSAVRQTKLTNSLGIAKELLFYLPQMLLLMFGGLKVIHHELDLGYFVASISYLQMFLNSLESFLGLADGWQAQISVWQRLNTLLNKPEEIKDDKANRVKIESYGIAVDHFSYGEKLVLQSIEKVFDAGKIFCLYGTNGSGKSTFLKLLANCYVQGKRKVNQRPLSLPEMISFREQAVSYLPQEPIYIDQLNAVDNLCTSLETVPVKLGSWIDELGDKKSKHKKEEYSIGQLQKISIMRTLATNRPVLLLDEPTNHLDQKAKNTLIECLLELKKEHIIIIASHDPRIEEIADETIIIGEGNGKVQAKESLSSAMAHQIDQIERTHPKA